MYARLMDHWPQLEETSVKGTLALMTEADARGVRRFIHAAGAALREVRTC